MIKTKVMSILLYYHCFFPKGYLSFKEELKKKKKLKQKIVHHLYVNINTP